jgi:hypothetical protein
LPEPAVNRNREIELQVGFLAWEYATCILEPCAETYSGFEDVVKGAIIQIGLVVTKKLHVSQKLLAIDLI